MTDKNEKNNNTVSAKQPEKIVDVYNNINLDNPKYYENRELSWLEFNQRVLDEAENNENPLFERLKFLAIVSSNLDEFFMVRVASIIEQIEVGYDKPDFSGLLPTEQYVAITRRAHRMIEDQSRIFKRSLIPALRKQGIQINMEINKLTEYQNEYLSNYFDSTLFPTLTPLAVDASRPFPLILNKSYNIGVLIKKGADELFATVQVPSVISRFIEIPTSDASIREFVMLADVIKFYLDRLFHGYEVVCAYKYRITRSADLDLDEEEAVDLLIEIEKSVKLRKWGEPIRLEIEDKASDKIVNYLKQALGLSEESVYRIDGPIDLTFLMKLYDIKGTKDLKFNDYTAQIPKDLLGEEDIFEAISQKDIFLHHPFESFDPVINLITKAAKDKNVLAIKQTLYRVSGKSPIIQALTEAAESGKQVTVLVELKARFDEENNIQWARRLEKAGCHVIYGLVGLKTHSKVTLIVRKEESGIKRYVHLGTGNYNDITARFYTDMGLLTANEMIGRDISLVFNTLSGYSEPPKLFKIVMAPTHLRDKFIQLIRKESQFAREGKEAKIICKMNSLCDQEIIKELYKASIDGVKVELIVRGICSLIPGIKGVSENITVRSIVGKYLEHTRIFYFYQGGYEQVYLSSADWMPRNLDRRVELLFPIESEHVKQRVIATLNIQLKDVMKAKIKDMSCEYQRIDRRGKEAINSQFYFEEEAIEQYRQFAKITESEVFIPRISLE